jgi:hypothetical protein
MDRMATAWRRLPGIPARGTLGRVSVARGSRTTRTNTVANAPALADYGEAKNLLECVPTYQHGVAAFNAANVWMSEQLARLLRARGAPGDAGRAAALDADADAVARAVLGLYVEGEGVWSALYPNGTRVAVRTVIDYVYVSEFMRDRLPQKTLAESHAFAERELLTSTWMRALSLRDPAAPLSDRTDHGPHGSYDGWPPLVVAAMARSGRRVDAARFLRSTAPVTRLGPYGQAHGVDARRGGAAYKPFEFTLFNELTGLDFVDAVVTAIFGLQPADAPELLERSAPPVAAPSASRGVRARLAGVRWQGRLYDATAGEAGVVWTQRGR